MLASTLHDDPNSQIDQLLGRLCGHRIRRTAFAERNPLYWPVKNRQNGRIITEFLTIVINTPTAYRRLLGPPVSRRRRSRRGGGRLDQWSNPLRWRTAAVSNHAATAA